MKVKENHVNPYHAIGLLLYPMKTSDTQTFCSVFREYRKRPVAYGMN